MMGSLSRRGFLTGTVGLVAGGALRPAFGAADESHKGQVTGQPEGAEAGRAVLTAGGNAVDAIVTAALVAGVVAVPMTGIAGYGGSLVVCRPDGQVFALEFNSTAPAALRPDYYGADAKGNVKDQIHTFGWLAVGVPGVLAGLQTALDRFGSKPFADLVRPAIRYAREGFPVTKGFATTLRGARARLVKDPGSARLFFSKNELLGEGATFRNPDLADLLQTLAQRGNVASFYKGDIADAIATAFRKNGGLVTREDLAAYRAREVPPLSLPFHGHVIHTPPPTSGGLTVLQTLATLQALEIGKGDIRDPAAVHTRVEALRLAWNDRLSLLGDPDFVDVPMERLLSTKYAETCATRVRAAVQGRTRLEGTSDGRSAAGTIHLNAVDARGLTVALTLTHGGGLGAQVTIDGLGLVLGHGMSRFDPRPGRANSPAPGKRPLHNMCPTVVTRQGKPLLALGATGGRRIPNTLLDVLTYRLGYTLPLSEAVKAPRMHTEGDDALTLEAAWPGPVQESLKGIGYKVKPGPGATLNAIERDLETGKLLTVMR